MGHNDLVSFLRRAKAALRHPSDMADDEQAEYGKPIIVVKENCCEDSPEGGPNEFLDEEDSSLTRYVPAGRRLNAKLTSRSNGKWLQVFEEAGLRVIKEEVQEGLPQELFTVKTWALQ